MNLNKRQTNSNPDIGKKPSIDDILQNAVQFANSYGLQPFKIIVRKEDINDKLTSKQNAYLVVFAIRPEFTRKHISAFIRDLTALKHIPGNSLDSYREEFESKLNDNNGGGKKWAAKQALLAVDILLDSAKQNGADAQMLEDINPDQYSQELGVDEKGWQALTALIIIPPAVKAKSRKNLDKTMSTAF
jgi:hypothetical protein